MVLEIKATHHRHDLQDPLSFWLLPAPLVSFLTTILIHLLSEHTSHPANGKPAAAVALWGVFSHQVPAILNGVSDKILLSPKNLSLALVQMLTSITLSSKNICRRGAPGGAQSIKHRPSAQVLLLGFWVRVPH